MKSFEKQFRKSTALVAIVAVLAGIFAPTFSAEAAIANTITFQGRLLSSPTAPAANLTYQMRFSLWSDADFVDGTDRVNGALVGAAWQEVQTITTDSQGFFIADVGSVSGLPEFDSSTHRFLQAEVKSNGAPDSSYFLLDNMLGNSTVDRKSVMNSAYAQNAKQLDGHNLGFTAGKIPYLNANGEFDRSILDIGTWHDPVATIADLANVPGKTAGSVVFVIGDNSLHTFDGTSWTRIGTDLQASIDSLSAQITGNDADIATNAGNIATNAADIAANLSAIQSNDADIAANLSAIQSNDADIAANLSAIQSNDADIAANLSAIQSNDTDIANLQTEMSNRYTKSETDNLISTAIQGLSWKDPVATVADLPTTGNNAGDTSYVTGTGEIYTFNGTAWVKTGADFFQTASTTAEGIVQLATDGEVASGKAVQANDSRLAQVGTNTTNISTNAGNIATNATDIAANLSAIQSNDGDITTLQGETSANATNISANSANISTNSNDISTLNNFISTGFDVFILP